LADGISGAGLMGTIMDSYPRSLADLEKKKNFRAPPLPDRGTSLVNALLTSWPERANRILSMQAEALEVGRKIIAAGERGAFLALAPFLPELLAPVERLPFNQPCEGPQKVAWSEMPLADAKAIK